MSTYRKGKLQQFTKSALRPYKIPKYTKHSTYEVKVIHMHGDADRYTTDINDFSLPSEMLDFVNFILRCMAAYPNGMGGDDRYDHIKDYDKYEESLFSDNECFDGHASPNEMEIIYYDSQSIKWDVKLSN